MTLEPVMKAAFEGVVRFSAANASLRDCVVGCFDWDPFAHLAKDLSTVGALRALATDVDTSRMSRDAWRLRNEAAGIGAV